MSKQKSPIDDRTELDISDEEESSFFLNKRSLGFLMAIAGLAILALITSGRDTFEHTRLEPGKADELRQEMLAMGNGKVPNYTIIRIREGVERFLITDINNAACSAQMQLGAIGGQRNLGGDSRFYFSPSMPPTNDESYDMFEDNQFLEARITPLSTFSIDVDTASYTNIRRYLKGGQLPPKDVVRIEECINYFDYQYADTQSDQPFSVTAEIGSAPWNPENRLALIGLKGYEPSTEEVPPLNLIFLIDVSGSMSSHNKLPLVQETLNFLVSRLRQQDRIGIVVYAGAAGAVLEPTAGDRKDIIHLAINRLESGGSTNGGQGIELAYKMAMQYYKPNAVNRVIMCTDGDFNVGTTARRSLVDYVQEQAKKGIDLTMLGFGMGNLKDGMLEQLADKGNGNYAYIDQIQEAHRVFGEKMFATLMTIAQDVKIQVEFNPSTVQAYRLIGYVNRKLADRDFNDDTKDAGDIGAGHTVTALYEIVPAGVDFSSGAIDPLRYSSTEFSQPSSTPSDELMNIKLRYKQPKGHKSVLLEFPVVDTQRDFNHSSENLRFAASVASYGMLLRGSHSTGNINWGHVHQWASQSLGSDPYGHRREFLELIERAQQLS